MSSSSLPSLHPAALPPGTPVGPFRVLEWAGRGVHGAVYRAERIGREHLPPVALKLAVLPEDPRYLREQELLSRSHHPHIPRLVGAGLWVSPEGARHPFMAMQWVDGVPLYDWGRMWRPSAAQQLRLLAHAALTLQYLHAQGALHRDFKGDNLLVRRWGQPPVPHGLRLQHLPRCRHAHPSATASGHSRVPLPRGLALHPGAAPCLRALPGRARG